jgi:MOSC domain-containing protein YiiM
MTLSLAGIAVAPKIMAPMEKQNEAEVTIEAGITNDARGRKRLRQVSVLFADDWADACQEISKTLDWSDRRANLLITGGRSPQQIGGLIRIGEVELRVVEETAPCELMEATSNGLRQALTPDWRGGVCCQVQHGGNIKIGDKVTVE